MDATFLPAVHMLMHCALTGAARRRSHFCSGCIDHSCQKFHDASRARPSCTQSRCDCLQHVLQHRWQRI